MNDAREKAARAAERLQARAERHREHSGLYRLAWIIAGAIVLVAGLAMLVLPGPAVIVVPIGLAMLSLEFAWANRALVTALRGGASATDSIAHASPSQKIGLALAALALVAAAVIVTRALL